MDLRIFYFHVTIYAPTLSTPTKKLSVLNNYLATIYLFIYWFNVLVPKFILSSLDAPCVYLLFTCFRLQKQIINHGPILTTLSALSSH